jgi:hypothetical protein
MAESRDHVREVTDGPIRRRLSLTLVAVLWLAVQLLVPWQARADFVTYTIEPSLSYMDVSGYAVNTLVFAEQKPGSLHGHLEGSIIADLNGSMLTFSGESVIDAQLHPAAPFIPAGAGEDNYGVIDEFGGIFYVAAIRDAVTTVASGTLEFGQPVENLVMVGFRPDSDGTFDYDEFFTPSSGSVLLNTLDSALNTSRGVLEQSIAQGVETITIPVEVSMPFMVMNEGDSQLNLRGQIVASRALVIPEPGSLTLIITGAIAWGAFMAARSRRAIGGSQRSHPGCHRPGLSPQAGSSEITGQRV